MQIKPTTSTGRLEVVPDNRSSVKSIPERIAAIRVLTHEERVDLAESEVRILDYGSHYLVDQAIIGVHESGGGVLSAVYARGRLIHCMMLERWLGNLGGHSDEALVGLAEAMSDFDPSDDVIGIDWYDENFWEEMIEDVSDTMYRYMTRYGDDYPMLVIEGPEPDAEESHFSFRGRRMAFADTGAEF